ncbi:MAG: glycosyltransferase family 9 protein [Proteobacteria bacterium]|nr:MAG: glycosyltransferase family 9 protein [Pseudomonadota bacterium]
MERGNSFLKFLDGKIGPLLIMFLWPSKRLLPKRIPNTVKRLGLIKMAAIGDTVILSAIISDLKSAWPGIKITLFVGSSNFEFAKLLSGVDEVVKLPVKNPIKAVRLIRSRDLDVCIDSDSWPRISALLAFFSGAYAIGFKTPNQNRHFLFDSTLAHSNEIHELDNYRNLLKPLGVLNNSLPQDLGYSWSPNKVAPYLVFHLWPGGTKSFLKEWALENWLSLIEETLKSNDVQITLTGGNENKAANDSIISRLPAHLAPRVRNTAGESFRSTLRVLQQSSGLVSVNTGVMHVGAALGVPTIGLHGPTNPLRWGPLGATSVSIVSTHPKAATLNLGFEYVTEENLMNSIPVAQVSTEIKKLILIANSAK